MPETDGTGSRSRSWPGVPQPQGDPMRDLSRPLRLYGLEPRLEPAGLATLRTLRTLLNLLGSPSPGPARPPDADR